MTMAHMPKYMREPSRSPSPFPDPLTDPRFDCADLSSRLATNLRERDLGVPSLPLPPDDEDVDIETWLYRLMTGDHEAARAPHFFIRDPSPVRELHQAGFSESRPAGKGKDESLGLSAEGRGLEAGGGEER